jgi:hypothetical protein
MKEQARQENTEGEIEKLRHRLRIQDAVIRSGNVAALTDEERKALEYGISEADAYDRVGLEDAKHAGIVFRALLERLGGK